MESFENVHQGGQVTNNKFYVQSCEITKLSPNNKKEAWMRFSKPGRHIGSESDYLNPFSVKWRRRF